MQFLPRRRVTRLICIKATRSNPANIFIDKLGKLAVLKLVANRCSKLLNSRKVVWAALSFVVFVAGLTIASTGTYACSPSKDGMSVVVHQARYTAEVKASTPQTNIAHFNCCTDRNQTSGALCTQSHCSACSTIAPVHVVELGFYLRVSYLCPLDGTGLTPASSDVDFRPPRLIG